MRRNNVKDADTQGTALRRAASTAWLEALDPEDLMFVRRLVLASGSLKAVARSYDISYPTVRLRLDRLIQKIEVVEAHSEASPFERQLRRLCAEGRLDLEAVQLLLDVHHEAIHQMATHAGEAPPRTGERL